MILKLAIAGVAGYFGFKLLKEKASNYATNNLSFAVVGGRIHNINLSNLDLRIDIDFTNLTPANVKIDDLEADIYFIKPTGQPDYLAKTKLSAFNISANKTNRINDIKIIVPAMALLRNREIITTPVRKFKAIIKASVNGSDFTTTQEFTV